MGKGGLPSNKFMGGNVGLLDFCRDIAVTFLDVTVLQNSDATTSVLTSVLGPTLSVLVPTTFPSLLPTFWHPRGIHFWLHRPPFGTQPAALYNLLSGTGFWRRR